MSVELKNWKELCKEKDERIKELEGKFDLIVERLEEYRDDFMENVYRELESDSDNNRANRIIYGFDEATEMVKEVGGIDV